MVASKHILHSVTFAPDGRVIVIRGMDILFDGHISDQIGLREALVQLGIVNVPVDDDDNIRDWVTLIAPERYIYSYD